MKGSRFCPLPPSPANQTPPAEKTNKIKKLKKKKDSSDLYSGFAADARKEGFADHAQLFTKLQLIEARHVRAIQVKKQKYDFFFWEERGVEGN